MQSYIHCHPSKAISVNNVIIILPIVSFCLYIVSSRVKLIQYLIFFKPLLIVKKNKLKFDPSQTSFLILTQNL